MSPHDHEYKPEMPVYLRIGDWHPSETSRNYSAGDTEAGVSVYELTPDGSIIVPEGGEWSAQDLSDRLKLGLTRHLVQGKWVGCGGEGEPLLKGIVQIGLWPDDLPDGFRTSVLGIEGLTVVTIDEAPRPSGAATEAHSF